MIEHVVFMKFKKGVSEERLGDLEKGLAALPGLIPEIRSYTFGRDVLHSPRSCDFALVSDFDDLEALKRYITHPDHQAIVAIVLDVCESTMIVDFERQAA